MLWGANTDTQTHRCVGTEKKEREGPCVQTNIPHTAAHLVQVLYHYTHDPAVLVQEMQRFKEEPHSASD